MKKKKEEYPSLVKYFDDLIIYARVTFFGRLEAGFSSFEGGRLFRHKGIQVGVNQATLVYFKEKEKQERIKRIKAILE